MRHSGLHKCGGRRLDNTFGRARAATVLREQCAPGACKSRPRRQRGIKARMALPATTSTRDGLCVHELQTHRHHFVKERCSGRAPPPLSLSSAGRALLGSLHALPVGRHSPVPYVRRGIHDTLLPHSLKFAHGGLRSRFWPSSVVYGRSVAVECVTWALRKLWSAYCGWGATYERRGAGGGSRR